MHKNPVWLGFLALVFASFLWYSGNACYHLYQYYSLKETAKATDLKWFVEEITSDDFRVGATYSFAVNNESYTGETLFSDHRFRNPLSADDELKIKATHEFVVFYDPQNLGHSSLEKKFPLKDCASAAALFLLLLYLFGLGIYTSIKSEM